jgi:hypothetical protein
MDLEANMKDGVMVGFFMRGFPATDAFALQPPLTTLHFHQNCLCVSPAQRAAMLGLIT